MQKLFRRSVLVALILTAGLQFLSAADDAELQRFHGHWKVIELVDDGKVIPQAAIGEWLPSGGKVEIAENAIIFTSPVDQKKHVKVFGIDATQYPNALDVMSRDEKSAWGIYKFDEKRLVICLSSSGEKDRPTDFSAKEGSDRMLMVLMPHEKTPVAETPPKKPSGTTGKFITDKDSTKLLTGRWKIRDSAGTLFLTMNGDGTCSTVREVQKLRVFQKIFVQTPISTGTWSVIEGKIRFHILASVNPGSVNKVFDFTLRSISHEDFIFVDFLGTTGRALRAN